jgi:SecD/SecF fusion protein
VAERRNHLLLVGLIAAALIASLLLLIPGSPVHQKATLGLDLQGGLEVILKAVPPENRPLRSSDLDRSVGIIRDRIDKLGVSEPEVRKLSSDQISVSLPGVKDPDRVRDVIGSTAKLELYDLQTALTGPSIDAQGFNPVPNENLYDLLASAQTQSLASRSEGGGPYYLFKQDGKELVAGPLRTEEALRATAKAKAAGVTADTVPKGYKIFKVPNETAVVTCGEGAVVCPGVQQENPVGPYYYLFKYNPAAEGAETDLAKNFPQMTGNDLKLQGTRQDFDPQSGGPIVLMSFTKDGGDKFHDITRAEAQRGRRFYSLSGSQGDPQNYNQNFAIVLDREIRSFPSIDFQQYPDGISGSGGAQITGLAGVQEAKDLALVLQTGALPVVFRTLSETQISATLGEDSLHQALIAAIVGFLIVALFLLVFYRFLGLVAVLGLGIYAVFLYAMLLVFNVTLTLPGFAGMILTIGVAADANIVIFERIKEEARSGKSVRAAINAGYGKGFSTIVDANVVTAITALVLFSLATAGVKGFALMLLLGTAISLITAVVATRAMLGLLAGFRWFDSPRFMGAEGAMIPKWIQHDYVGKRKIWFSISAVVVLISVVSLGIRGLNLGIDFEGGTKITFTTPQATSLSEVRDQADQIGQANAVIQGAGNEVGDQSYREFVLRTEALEPGEVQQLRADLRNAFDVAPNEVNVTTVSASFGRQIAESAIYAVLFSLLLVAIYISFRFQWKFALATMVALLHDLIIAVGIYSLLGREVTTSTVAAILTVLGYSIYDTIIILDRVRENIPLMRRAPFQQIANISLWETIRRSLATTFITLLPITSLYLFGGDTLRDFAFALLVGIGSGAYSSIFIAAPLVSWLKEREPEYARREAEPYDRETMEVVAEEAEEAAAEEPVPALAQVAQDRPRTTDAKRERRSQRRKARPHGRAR